MSIEGQGHFFTIYFPGFVCFVLYLAKISGERLQDHWSSGSETIAACDLKVGRCRRYVNIEGQGHFFTIYFPGFVCFVLN